MAFTRTWDATYMADPEDTDAASGFAEELRFTRVDVHERMEIDHLWAGDSKDGLHGKAELYPYGSDPLLVDATSGVIYVKTVSGQSELFFMDSTSTVWQLTDGGDLRMPTSGLITDGTNTLDPHDHGARHVDITTAAGNAEDHVAGIIQGLTATTPADVAFAVDTEVTVASKAID